VGRQRRPDPCQRFGSVDRPVILHAVRRFVLRGRVANAARDILVGVAAKQWNVAPEKLVAANANVGAAKALFFPTISLTGLLGTLSGDFSNLLKADSNVWSVSPGLFQPLFQGGRIRRNYEAAQARFDQALAQYQKSALSGYREVADSLVTIQKLALRRVEQEKGVVALTDAAKLSRERYDSGLANYLEILIADQQLFTSELELARTRGAELRALVQLYRALGGGWQPETAAATSGGGTPR
jgi:multidrug efflux system outer membrane protein